MISVYVDQQVHDCIDAFYEYAKRHYISLDELTVMQKVERIYNELYRLGDYAHCYGYARLKKDWIKKKYKECIIEDFHFAFQLYRNEYDEVIVYVHDASHSLLYY